jgi:hypothetical protein
LNVININTYVHLWSYIAQFFLKWENFQVKFVQKIKTRILCSLTFFFRKSCRSLHNVEEFGTARQATDDNTIQSMRTACCITKATDAQLEYSFLTATVVTWERFNITLIHTLPVLCYSNNKSKGSSVSLTIWKLSTCTRFGLWSSNLLIVCKN